MIIDASEKFAQRNTKNWFKKLSGSNKHLTSKIIPIHIQPMGTSELDLTCDPTILTPDEITHLKNSASLLVTHSEEIATLFYQNVLKTMWWNHSKFQEVVANEKDRLLSCLLAITETPTECSRIAFFLVDNWAMYRHMSNIGESYDTITYFLNNAIDDVLGEYFTPEVCIAWRKVLAPRHVFNHTSNTNALKKN